MGPHNDNEQSYLADGQRPNESDAAYAKQKEAIGREMTVEEREQVKQAQEELDHAQQDQ